MYHLFLIPVWVFQLTFLFNCFLYESIWKVYSEMDPTKTIAEVNAVDEQRTDEQHAYNIGLFEIYHPICNRYFLIYDPDQVGWRSNHTGRTTSGMGTTMVRRENPGNHDRDHYAYSAPHIGWNCWETSIYNTQTLFQVFVCRFANLVDCESARDDLRHYDPFQNWT
jgi:hypothetical protein